jgi:hypothetical protein
MDKDYVVDGPSWVVDKHTVLLQEFNPGLKPRYMVFNKLKVWARIFNLPFGYMHKRWGDVISSSLCMEGSVPVVYCDDIGRCWGSFMRVRVEVDIDKMLRRGVKVFSQCRNTTDWFDVQYEQLPHYCFSCGVIGHSSLECKDPGERDAEGNLPYLAEFLCASDDRRKKMQGTRSSSGSVSDDQNNGQAPVRDQGDYSVTVGGEKGQNARDIGEVSSPAKKKNLCSHPNQTKAAKGQGRGKELVLRDGNSVSGQKLKNHQEYRPKPSQGVADQAGSLAMAVHGNARVEPEEETEEIQKEGELSSDSNKKMRTIVDKGSTDLVGAAQQSHCTQ